MNMVVLLTIRWVRKLPRPETLVVLRRLPREHWLVGTSPQVIRYIQDVRYHTDDDGSYAFDGNTYITGAESLKVTEPDVTFSGAAAETTFTDGYIVPEITKYSGELIYLTNISPILRQPTQNEKITLIISY